METPAAPRSANARSSARRQRPSSSGSFRRAQASASARLTQWKEDGNARPEFFQTAGFRLVAGGVLLSVIIGLAIQYDANEAVAGPVSRPLGLVAEATPVLLASDDPPLSERQRARLEQDLADREERLAEELAALAVYALRQDDAATATRYLDQAVALRAEDGWRDAVSLREAIGELQGTDDEPSERGARRVARRVERESEDLAAAYRAVVDLRVQLADGSLPDDAAPLIQHADRFHPTGTESHLHRHLERMIESQRWQQAEAVFALLDELVTEPDEALVEARATWRERVELLAAEREPSLRQCATHEIKYYLTLPRGWSPDETYPIVLGFEGAGCNFLGYTRGLVRARGERPYIVVTPHTFSNTNAISERVAAKYSYDDDLIERIRSGDLGRYAFDEPGTLAVLDEVRERFGGQARIFVTGFSGGGLMTWRMALAHSDTVRAAVPMCGNFVPGLAGGVEQMANPEVRIHGYQGEEDPYLDDLNTQWGWAEQVATALGMTRLTRDMVPEVRHSAMHARAIAFFAAVIEEDAADDVSSSPDTSPDADPDDTGNNGDD